VYHLLVTRLRKMEPLKDGRRSLSFLGEEEKNFLPFFGVFPEEPLEYFSSFPLMGG